MFLHAFHGQLRVRHVDGDVIPPFWAPIITKLYKFIHLSIKNLLIFIIIQFHKPDALNYVAIPSSLSPWH